MWASICTLNINVPLFISKASDKLNGHKIINIGNTTKQNLQTISRFRTLEKETFVSEIHYCSLKLRITSWISILKNSRELKIFSESKVFMNTLFWCVCKLCYCFIKINWAGFESIKLLRVSWSRQNIIIWTALDQDTSELRRQ